VESLRNDPGWWYKDLEGNPKFKQALGAN